jgi:hypothetical protein
MLFTQIEILQKQSHALQKKIEAIRGQVNQGSHNSSNPLSSDGYKKASPKSLRKKKTVVKYREEEKEALSEYFKRKFSAAYDEAVREGMMENPVAVKS